MFYYLGSQAAGAQALRYVPLECLPQHQTGIPLQRSLETCLTLELLESVLSTPPSLRYHLTTLTSKITRGFHIPQPKAFGYQNRLLVPQSAAMDRSLDEILADQRQVCAISWSASLQPNGRQELTLSFDTEGRRQISRWPRRSTSTRAQERLPSRWRQKGK